MNTPGSLNSPGPEGCNDQFSTQLDYRSNVQHLEIQERTLRIEILKEEQIYKSQRYKIDLVNRQLDAKKKEADFDHLTKLKELLLKAIEDCDYERVSCLNQSIINQSIIYYKPSNSQYAASVNQSDPLLYHPNRFANVENSAVSTNSPEDFSGEEHLLADSKNEESEEVEYEMKTTHETTEQDFDASFVGMHFPNGRETNHLNVFKEESQSNQLINESKRDEDNDEIWDANNERSSDFSISSKIDFNKKIVRHILCSSSKLEDYVSSAVVKILFKGKCNINRKNFCNRREEHSHYLIDLTDCNRHISLYFQCQRYMLKFFKTSLVKNHREFKQIADTFQMKPVSSPYYD